MFPILLRRNERREVPKTGQFLTFLSRYVNIRLNFMIIILSARDVWRHHKSELNKPIFIHLSCVGADDTSGIEFADCHRVATDLG